VPGKENVAPKNTTSSVRLIFVYIAVKLYMYLISPVYFKQVANLSFIFSLSERYAETIRIKEFHPATTVTIKEAQ